MKKVKIAGLLHKPEDWFLSESDAEQDAIWAEQEAKIAEWAAIIESPDFAGLEIPRAACERCTLIVTPSTRENVLYQVTYTCDGIPTCHDDITSQNIWEMYSTLLGESWDGTEVDIA